jgi:hypothetical protein
MTQSIEITGTQRIPLEAELMMDDHFYINTTAPVVHNVVFDIAAAHERLESLLVLDAEKDLNVVEENPFVTVTMFCQKWFQRAFGVEIKDTRRIELLKEIVTETMEKAVDEPADYTEIHVDESLLVTFKNGEEVRELVKRRERRRITKGCRSMFAASLATRVKVKFGTLHYNEANQIMVHRWLSGIVDEEFKDLRNCDKALALERATFMSFVTSADFSRFKVLFEDKLMQDRLLVRFGAQA